MLGRHVVTVLVALTAVNALPAPQNSACDQSCLSLASAAQTCGTSATLETAQCLCSAPGFLTGAQACVDCGGGTIFTGSNLGLLRQAIQACGVLGATGGAAASGAAPSVTSAASQANATAIAVTENPTQPITISAWRPSGYTPSLSYYIEATGGQNTTIQAVETVTVTNSASSVLTATVTVGFVLEDDEIVQYQAVDQFLDVTTCEIEDNDGGVRNGTLAECEDVYYASSIPYTTSTFTVGGETTAWTAFALPTASPSFSIVLPTQTAGAAASVSGSAAPSGSIDTSLGNIPVGTVGGSPPASTSSG